MCLPRGRFQRDLLTKILFAFLFPLLELHFYPIERPSRLYDVVAVIRVLYSGDPGFRSRPVRLRTFEIYHNSHTSSLTYKY
jgi:hypothetical protein